MDAKDLKSLLKQTRDAINNKDYALALQLSGKILSCDQENYTAWVFKGVASQETGDNTAAEMAFQRATQITPTEPLAWQGLRSFYEKQKRNADLYDVLLELLKIFSNVDPSKHQECLGKLLTVAADITDRSKFVEALKLQLELTEVNPTKEQEIWRSIWTEINNDERLGVSMKDLKEKALQKIIQSTEFSVKDCQVVVVDSCLEPKLKQGLYSECLQMTDLISLDEGKKMCIECIIKSCISGYIKQKTIPDCFEEIVTRAENWESNDYLLHLLHGLQYFISKNYTSALQMFKSVFQAKPDCLEGLYLMSQTQLLLHLNIDVQPTIKSGLRISLTTKADSEITGRFYLGLGVSEAKCRNWETSFKAYEKCIAILGRTPEVLTSLCISLLDVGQTQEAQKIYAELYAELDNAAIQAQLEGFLHMSRGEYPVALKKLRESFSLEESAFTLHLVGCALWKMEDFEKAVKIFIKAGEMDPFFAKNFLFIGHYYMKFTGFKNKACQCYKKAFDLDPTSEEIGMALSLAYESLGDNDAHLAFLHKITQDSPVSNCKWVWIRLGILQMDMDLPADAISSFQNAVRFNLQSSYTWECLADAYLKRGSLESAVKAYEKAFELNPEAKYPLYQISSILKTRGLHEEAVAKYDNLLQLHPTYIPALTGISESFVLLGKNYVDECLFGRARDCFQEALHVIARALSIDSSLCCLWKLAGDACTFCFYFDEKDLILNIPLKLHEGISNTRSKEEILSLGAKFYGRALLLNKDLSGLWWDLGVNCHFRSFVCSHPANKELALKAQTCLKKAVSLVPTSHEHWTALGIVSSGRELEDYSLAQHAFIKSIELESNNAEAWTNLGALYLVQGNIELAHMAFQAAQSLDPSYPLCWTGQSVIASQVARRDESTDLFRHASSIGTNVEALLGYGRSVCQMLLDASYKESATYKYSIEQMDAVVVASDCIIKFIANHNEHAEAFNLLGILLERQHLNNGAVKAFEQAVIWAENDNVIELYRTNFARSLRVVGRYEEALSEYAKIQTTDVTLLCSFALTLFKNNEFETACSVLEKAFQRCQIPNQKSNILVAMALMLRKSTNADPSKVQKLLIESTQLKPLSVHGLLALWSLGIINKQMSLAAAAQVELLPFKDILKFTPPVALLSSLQAYILTGYRAARAQLLGAIRKHPHVPELWMQAALCMLQWDTRNAEVAAILSRRAVHHNGNKKMASQIYALSRLALGHKRASLSAAQKAVHLRPDKAKNWITLSAACHIAGEDRNNIGWILNFVKNKVKEQRLSMDVLGWVVGMDVFNKVYSRDFPPAQKVIQQVLNTSSFNTHIRSVLEILQAFIQVRAEGRIEPLVSSMRSSSAEFLCWQIVAQWLIRCEKYEEAEKVLEKFYLTSSKSFTNLSIYPLLQMVTLSMKAAKVSEDKQKWIQKCEDSITEAIKLFPTNSATRFLHAAMSLENGNMSLVRRSLEKVVFAAVDGEHKWMDITSAKILMQIYKQKEDGAALEKLASVYPAIL